MGFDRKSDAGPYEGMTGQQRYMSDVLYGYYPLLIDALNYQMFGCNAIFTEPSFKIHEAYGVNTTIEKSIVQVAETLSFEKDSIGNYDIATSSDAAMTSKYYNMICVTMYKAASKDESTSVNRFVLPANDLYEFMGQNIMLPNVPFLYPWKFYKDVGTATYFAGHQIQIPVLYDTIADVAEITIGTEDVKLKFSNSDIEVNNTLSAKAMYSLGGRYCYGSSETVFNSTARWSTPNDDSANHIRSMRIIATDTGAGTGMCLLTMAPRRGMLANIIKVKADGTNYSMYSGPSYSDEQSVSPVYGFAYVSAPLVTLAAIDAAHGGTVVGKKVGWTIALLYYILSTDVAGSVHGYPVNGISLPTHSFAEFLTWRTANGITLGGDYTLYDNDYLYQNAYTIAFANIASYAYLIDSGIYLPKFTNNCASESGTYDQSELYEDSARGLVVSKPGDSTNQFLAYSISGAGYSDLEMEFTKEIPDLTLTIGFYSPYWSGWVQKVIATANTDYVSTNIISKTAYIYPIASLLTTKIVDTVLLQDKFMAVTECDLLESAGNNETDPSYQYNNAISGIASDMLSTVADTSASGIGIVNQNTNTNHVPYLLYVDNLETTLLISNPEIRSLISLTDIYDLTFVKPNESNSFYFGILNTNTLRHYSPVNLLIEESILFDEQPTVTKINILKNNSYAVSAIVQTTNGVYYLSFRQLKDIPGAVFSNSDTYKDQYILSVYYIDKENNSLHIESVNTEGIGMDNGVTLFANVGITKSIKLLEYDENVAYMHKQSNAYRFNISSVVSYPSYNYLDNALVNVSDISSFASNAIKIPMLYPHEGLSIVSDDVGVVAYAAVTGVAVADAINLHYYATRLMNYNPDLNSNIGGVGRLLKSGSVVILTLPSIDYNVKNYSVLPEKTTSIIGIDDMQMLNKCGKDCYSANDRSYVKIGGNLYLSSRQNMIPKNAHGLFNLHGEIFHSGNIFIVTDDRQSSVYTINENSIPTLMKTIDGVCITNPVSIGKEMIIVCSNGIYSLYNDNLYNFPFLIAQAVLKPVTGNGYLLYVYSNDKTDTDVELVAINEDVLTASNDEVLTFEGLYDNYRTYNINDSLNIIELESVTDTLDPNELIVIDNNCYGNNVSVYAISPEASVYSYKPCAYKMIESGSYHTNPYIISEPVQLRNQKAEIAIADAAFIYTKGQGSITFYLYDGVNTVVEKTLTIGNGSQEEYTENKIELGMVEYDNLYYKIIINPTVSDDLRIQTVKIRLNYLQEP